MFGFFLILWCDKFGTSPMRSWMTPTLSGHAQTPASCFLTRPFLVTWENPSVALWTRAAPALLLTGMLCIFSAVSRPHSWIIAPLLSTILSILLFLFLLYSGSLAWAALPSGLRTSWQTTLNIWSCWGGWESASSTWKMAGCSWSSTPPK